MHPARIAELLQPFLSVTPNPCHSEQGQRPDEEPTVLSPTQLQHISTYIDILFRWNARSPAPPVLGRLGEGEPLSPPCGACPGLPHQAAPIRERSFAQDAAR